MTSAVDLHQPHPFRDPLTAAVSSTTKRMLPSANYHTSTASRMGSNRQLLQQGSYHSSSSNTDHDYSTGVNRLSTLESSQNENNRRRPSALSTNGSSTASSAVPDGSAGTPTWTPKDYGASARSGNGTGSSSGTPTLHHSSSSSSMKDVGDSDSVVIEEKRRRPHGDGYSVHRYLRGRLLGKGGFAKVYLCTALDTNKNYAVKIVPKANLVKERARQKLQAEIKIHRTLKHDNICEYKHFFEDRDNCYILLELCHNQSMNEMIKRRKQLTEPEAIFFMGQMLMAVRYMHDNNVIHRDLKLGNLFLDKHLNMKVGDLGLATRLEDKDEKRKTICGTPNYIAPEIIQGDKAKRGHSFEVDVWSMGVILYTLLVGKPPYEAKDVKATYQRIINNEYSFPKHAQVSDVAKDLIGSMLQSVPTERPSLDEIAAHPFFTETLIPSSLPTSATHVAPVWQINEYGDIVVAEKGSVRKSSSKSTLPRSSSRQPFGSYDPNRNKASSAASDPAAAPKSKEKSGRDGIDMHGIVKSALAMAGSTLSGATASGFKIFDESTGRDAPAASAASSGHGEREHSARKVLPPQARSSPHTSTTAVDAELVARTKSLAIATPVSRKVETPSSPLSTANTSPVSETEADILQRMVERVETVIDITDSRAGTYRSHSPKALSRGGPTKWVTRYVDYTSKYGLGFLLNEGSSGVYFNDSTKTALESDGETFQYIERLAPSGEQEPSPQKVESTVETFTLSCYPESLKKKVTLLKHFRNYLLEQQKKADEDDSVVPSSVNAVAHDALVYVKKWVRTKHAILFRLSDQTIQIVFYDQTEILLTPDDRFITYVDKNRNRLTYTFTDELIGNHAELAKRLKYTKEILQQLLPGQRR